nr:PaaI family thioesterase [Ramlibacter albus]
MSTGNPLLDDLGIRVVEWRTGHCEMEMEVRERHLNRRGRLQGGVTATLLDAACGYAGLLREGDSEPGDAATITLTVNYLGKLGHGRLRAVGRVTGSGRSIYFASGELYAPDGALAATAQGSFKRASLASPGA